MATEIEHTEGFRRMDREIVVFLTGSRAYGSWVEGSDYDYRAVFMAPFHHIASGMYKTSPKQGEGDRTSFELGHFASLLCSGSPNAVELLFLPNTFYNHTPALEHFFQIRNHLLNRSFESACLGMASNLSRQALSATKVSKRVKAITHAFRILAMLEEAKRYRVIHVNRTESEKVSAEDMRTWRALEGDDQIRFLEEAVPQLESNIKSLREMEPLPDSDLKETMAEIVTSVRLRYEGMREFDTLTSLFDGRRW